MRRKESDHEEQRRWVAGRRQVRTATEVERGVMYCDPSGPRRKQVRDDSEIHLADVDYVPKRLVECDQAQYDNV